MAKFIKIADKHKTTIIDLDEVRTISKLHGNPTVEVVYKNGLTTLHEFNNWDEEAIENIWKSMKGVTIDEK